MEVVTARDFQKNFGAISDRVIAGETFRITRYGRPAMVLMSDSSSRRRGAFAESLANAKPTAAAMALTQEEINKMIEECFE